MPSYRSILTVGLLTPGRSPQDVEAAARAAVTALTTLEAFHIDVVAGQPRVTIRFTAEDDAQAREVHEHTTAAIRQVVQTRRVAVAKVVAGRSVPLP